MAGKYSTSKPALAALDKFISSPSSFVNLYRPHSKSVQAATVFNSQETRHIEPEQGHREPNHNPFFTFLTVFADPHTEWDVSSPLPFVSSSLVFRNWLVPSLTTIYQIEDLPYNLRTYRSQIYSDDLPDRRVGKSSKAALHEKYGVSIEKGSIVVVRPDGYVGAVVTLDQDGFEAINAYFAGFMKGQQRSSL